MNEDDYDYDEGSDIDNYEDEQVFQDDVADRKEQEEPVYLNHFQILLRTMEMIRKWSWRIATDPRPQTVQASNQNNSAQLS